MATYLLPQVRVFQDVAIAAADSLRELNAFVCGPSAALFRYDTNKTLISLGQYDHVGTNIDGTFQTVYSWPNRPVGALVDQTYTKVYIDDALLRYYSDETSAVIRTDSNKIRHPSVAFADNSLEPTTYPKSAVMKDRGAKAGDTVRIIASDGSGDHELLTYIRGFEGDTVDATVGTAAGASTNQATAAATTSDTADADNTGDVVIDSVTGTAYTGFVTGHVEETYVIEVIQASTGSDHTTARLRITSASGTDDVATKTPSAETVATAIGARGLTVTFDDGAGTDFHLGEKWTVYVREAWTAPAATAAGTYTGDRDRTYIVEVTTGGTSDGTASTDPYVTVNAADGSDFSGPTQVPTAAETAVPIGSYGVTMEWDEADLRKGDVYTVAVTAAKEGLMKTIVLGHNLHDDVPEDDAGTADIRLALYIKDDIEVPEDHVSAGGEQNWTQNATQISLLADIESFHDEWTDSDVQVALPVITESGLLSSNQAYVEYRAWRSDVAAVTPETIRDVADLDDQVPGELHPDNTLKWALFKALSNNDNGQDILYMGVPNPSDSSDWSDVLEKIKDRFDVYGLVPLTYDKTILDLFHAHVTAQSTELANRWRVLWVNLQVDESVAVVDDSLTSDEAVALGVTEDDPSASGTQYTILRVTSDNAELDELGVAPGDTLRYQYSTDAWGNVTYNEYTVDAVLQEDKLRLTSGTSAEESTPKKFEIWHNRSKTEQAEAIAFSAGAWGDRRVRAVWPDRISSGGQEMDGIHLCAALSALSGAVLPHQGLTNVELAGFDDVERTLKHFGASQLDTLAEAGAWIVTQDPRSGEVYTRHALTTGDQENLNEKEEMIVRNLDSISFQIHAAYEPYIGRANATPGILERLEAETNAKIQALRSSGYTQLLGGQLIDGEITDLRISDVFKDRVIVALSLELPAALNNLDVYLSV